MLRGDGDPPIDLGFGGTVTPRGRVDAGAEVSHCVTAYAPHGGITVAGNAYRSYRAEAPILWTCAQAFLRRGE